MAPPSTFTRCGVQTELTDARDRLAGKGLVQLHQIDLRNRQTGAVHDLASGRYRAQAHDGGIHAGNGRGHDPGHRPQAERAGPARFHDQRRRSPVVDPAGVARGHGAALAESRAQPGQGLGGRIRPRMLVGLHDDRRAPLLGNGDRHQLLCVPTFGDRRGRPPLAFQREGVLVLAADTKALGHVLARLAHRVGVVDRGQRRVDESPAQCRVDELVGAALKGSFGLEHHVGSAAHRFHPAGHEDVTIADCDRVCGGVDRLEPAATQTIHGQASDLRRQASQQGSHPGNVSIVLTGLVRAAQDDVLDERRVDSRSVEKCPNHGRRQIVRAYASQRPAVPAERRPQRGDDPGFTNGPVRLAWHCEPIVRRCRARPVRAALSKPRPAARGRP